MRFPSLAAAALLALPAAALLPGAVHAQMDPDHMQAMPAAGHRMYTHTFGDGWRIAGMAQVFPMWTAGLATSGTPLDDNAFYLSQPAAMINLESPGGTVVLRFTPNLEGLTQEDGELTFGGWGEGFIDARHPHTFLHELMLSVNLRETALGALSFSAGKGFAPYGTDDPMARPSAKYPTNHHLSQILERFTVNAAWLAGGWSLEVGVFGGGEPEGPWDLSNIDSFADSWSARIIRRFGPTVMGQARWELGASFAQVEHGHDDAHAGEVDHAGEAGHANEGGHTEGPTDLFNTSLRFDSPVGRLDRVYALAEFSRSDPADREGFWSFLAEASLQFGPHTPYIRYERSIRPEYQRDGFVGDAFFRYDHDAEPFAATAWSIVSVGYGFTATSGFASIRPFVEAQFFSVAGERGGVSAQEVLGDTRPAALTLGARVFLGGDPMRMGSYGLFDPITRMGR